MDAAAPSPGAAPGLVRLLEDCEQLGRLTQAEQGSARTRLEDMLGRELAGRLVGALTRSGARSALLV